MGFAGVATFGLWQLLYTVPRAQELVFVQIAAHGGDTAAIGRAYLVLTLASLVHAVTFYHLVGHMGAVTAGVMKGCQVYHLALPNTIALALALTLTLP